MGRSRSQLRKHRRSQGNRESRHPCYPRRSLEVTESLHRLREHPLRPAGSSQRSSDEASSEGSGIYRHPFLIDGLPRSSSLDEISAVSLSTSTSASQVTMGDSIHQSLSPSSVICTNQEDSARQTFNRPLPLRPSVHGREQLESDEITHPPSNEEQMEDRLTYQSSPAVVPSLGNLNWLYNDASLSEMLSPRSRYRHDPRPDHITSDLSIYHPSYQEVDQKVKEIKDELALICEEGAKQGNASWGELARTIRTDRSPYVNKPIRVGVVGDIGQGKSYLIGALLDDVEIVMHVGPSSRSHS